MNNDTTNQLSVHFTPEYLSSFSEEQFQRCLNQLTTNIDEYLITHQYVGEQCLDSYTYLWNKMIADICWRRNIGLINEMFRGSLENEQ